MTRRTSTLLLVAALAVGPVLAGCSEADREGIVDAVESAMDAATGSDGPTTPATPTAEPTATTEPQTEPSTQAPVATQEPTVTAPATEPTAAATEPTAQPSEAMVEEVPDDGIAPWVWVVLALVLLLVGVVAALLRRRRRARARVGHLRETVVTETDWLLSVAREHPSATDAVGRARDVRTRFDRLTEAVQGLRSAAGAELASRASDLHEPARQLADALVARLDDAAAGRRDDGGLGIPELVDRVGHARDRLTATRPRSR